MIRSRLGLIQLGQSRELGIAEVHVVDESRVVEIDLIGGLRTLKIPLSVEARTDEAGEAGEQDGLEAASGEADPVEVRPGKVEEETGPVPDVARVRVPLQDLLRRPPNLNLFRRTARWHPQIRAQNFSDHPPSQRVFPSISGRTKLMLPCVRRNLLREPMRFVLLQQVQFGRPLLPHRQPQRHRPTQPDPERPASPTRPFTRSPWPTQPPPVRTPRGLAWSA
ncbi:hypothetical protein G3I59_14855 [Amycolatopsis rubida]|uniref:Uncharacterized protein n=1 Tax=Amycolatopsis rubida TaxID=112413 RepID=A0ABX0BMF8_9PSEU|nr:MULTISPECIES: hypothetical protein [Amycolatopsis]MYW91842.1 hypothetical protein [Amycolatopsis rubida]NEC56827.1 hypothetical protein [Amycolatopsis rubida]